jgi:zinc protease
VFEVLTSQMKAMLANQEASPDWAFMRALESALTQNHPRARSLTPEMIDEMNLEKSLAFYKDRFSDASGFTFVFAGNFDEYTMRPLVERYLGSLPSSRRKETWKDVGIVPPRGIVEETVKMGIEAKSQAAIVFTGPFPYDSPANVALDAIGVILETRLRQNLREALGGTYGVQVDASANKIPRPRYRVAIQFGSDPRRTEELVKTVFGEIERLKADGPTEKEVNDAREALRRDHETALAMNNRLAQEIAARYESSEDISEFFELPSRYAKLSAGAIRDAARSSLDTSNYVRVTLYPENHETSAGREADRQEARLWKELRRMLRPAA